MISIIWAVLIIIGIISFLLTGNLDNLNNSIFNGANSSLEILLSLLPLIVLYSGIMKIAEDANLLNKFAYLLHPILKHLFPRLNKNHPALKYISSNIAANMLGLGSAATPFGLKAMEELQKDNKDKNVASDEMITFLVLNTAGVTIIPTSIIALRVKYNSINPVGIIVPAVIATFSSCISAIVIDYIIRRYHGK